MMFPLQKDPMKSFFHQIFLYLQNETNYFNTTANALHATFVLHEIFIGTFSNLYYAVIIPIKLQENSLLEMPSVYIYVQVIPNPYKKIIV